MKKIYIATILFIALCINQVNAKMLITASGRFHLSTYNVAITGNSHASYMSYFINVDNDLRSFTVGNHSVGGDDLTSSGNGALLYTDWKSGKRLIATKGELKGWINKVKNEAYLYDYIICWFGSNSTNWNPDRFKNTYRDWIADVRKVNKNCKLIIMAIPHTNYPDKDVRLEHSDWVIDIFNLKIKELIDELKLEDPNIFFEEMPETLEYSDRAHLNNRTYISIWNTLKEKYDIKVTKMGGIETEP